ncbi:hypothetical protein SAMN05421763_101756 [[Luteovulum] sphaeroides subsp. megalophilum]|uniref:hypothetical protein n=1 Tax=Cereibacter sphaeroides TaxID=1063 RepID=UPI000B6EAB7B|nr:hypothetical protein [Cereibacter sphaeroides]SNS29033.1 hypothetical protein SAMN05421763_101756 [[Luteovulum] sphaeroides subsp. megalophilum]
MAYAKTGTHERQGRGSALMLTSAVVLGAFGALAVRHLMSGRRTTHYPEVRQAGRDAMRDPPRDWDRLDETLDESFPASDPPATY